MAHKPREESAPSYHPLEDHPEYVKAIGMVALETIALELRLANLLARMLDIPLRIGQAIYLSPKAEQTRLDILRNAARSRLGVSPSKANTALGKQKRKSLSDVLKIVGRAQSLIGERHRVVHDEWNYSEAEKRVTRKMIDGTPGRPRTPASKDDMDALILKMRQLIDDAQELAVSFSKHPPFMADMRNDSTNS